MKRFILLSFGIAVMLSCATVGYSESRVTKKEIKAEVVSHYVTPQIQSVLDKIDMKLVDSPGEVTEIMILEVTYFGETIKVSMRLEQQPIEKNVNLIRPPPRQSDMPE